MKMKFSLLALLSCSILAPHALATELTDVTIGDYSKSSFVFESLDSGHHLAKVAYKLNDTDSLASGIEKAKAVSEEIIINSTPYGYKELSTLITTNVQDGDKIFVVVETSIQLSTSAAQSLDDMAYSKIIQSNKQHQMAIVTSVMDNSFSF